MIQLSRQQQEVFDQIKTFLESDSSIFILKGYAGTGKTTMIKAIADHLSKCNNFILMAPTGRAARVLQEKTGYPAFTIHKAIYGGFSIKEKKEKNIADTTVKFVFPVTTAPEEVIAIVDEASMVGSKKNEQEMYQFGTDNLMDDLLTFVRPHMGGKVIFVGDPAQLPPVGESVSQALNEEFFTEHKLKVMSAELTEVHRQGSESAILRNAMKIRDLLGETCRNRLVFEEKEGEVESISNEHFIDKYIELRKASGQNNCVAICFSNKAAAAYNKEIRQKLYGMENPPLIEGDILQIVRNNYELNRMNGEFVPVLEINEMYSITAPVYVQQGADKVQKDITLNFIDVTVPNYQGVPVFCMLSLDLLNNDNRSLTTDEMKALYINFCMRNRHLKPGSIQFYDALGKDKYFNCLQAKYGYAVTGHKCQGGEWANVFIDYAGRTGLNDDSLRWAYTATTRARKSLYFCNHPVITPFSTFRIDAIQKCSKISGDFRPLAACGPTPFHDASAPDYLRAKYACIESNMQDTPFRITNVASLPFMETYTISAPEGPLRFDLRYKQGGLFSKAIPQQPTENSAAICRLLDDECNMPVAFSYKPSDLIHSQLYNLIRSACDDALVTMTNAVEHPEDYSVIYYFLTSGSYSYIKIYFNAKGFITYAKPMSMTGPEDTELATLIKVIKSHCE